MNAHTLLLIARILDGVIAASVTLPAVRARQRATVAKLEGWIAAGQNPSDAAYQELIEETLGITSDIEAAVLEKEARERAGAAERPDPLGT